MWQASRGAASAARRLDLSGIMPPIPTPFNRDETIALDRLADNMRAWNAWPLAGYVVQGSNGEYPLMNAEERIEMVRQVKKLTPEGKLVIGGSSCESTQMTIDMSNKMADAGADAVMVVTPSYFKSSMTPQALKKHFVDVAEGSRIPVILYNMPANTGIDMSASLLAELAQHPNIIGVKDSGGDITKIGRLVYETKNMDFQVLAGSTGYLLPSLLVGAVGGVNGLANILGNEVCQIYKLASEGKFKEAMELHERILAPNSMVTRELGVPAMKEAMDMFGLYGGPCRRPLQPLTADQKSQLRETFKKCGFTPVK